MPALPSADALLTSRDTTPQTPASPPSHHDLLTRQQQGAVIAIPAQYAGLNSGPAPGAVAGIVLGSVAAFLFIIWLLWIASTGGGFLRSSRLTEEEVVVRHRSRSPGTVHRSHRSTRARTEMTSRSPRRERGDRVIRTERIVRDAGARVPMGREPSRIRESVFVDEVRAPRRVDGDDIVEVIEEHSSVGDAPPPPSRKTRSRRVSGGYRSVHAASSDGY
ncbi:hypothetical protein TI39_contig282g00003 [Zymoseptoria brevis]|uniref:Uncharacterized protein n=1 Tax=Zymoseptoria brevis TaxID=1047168 RepID=A0A0F4GW89_9PEZI|nr:hypothetical protein TI39_contig282g00003 [Zymoseptoria brevis]